MISCSEKEKPLQGRHYPSFLNFKDRYLYISGGENKWATTYYDSVDRYDILANEWTSAPKLNKKRAYHSSCTLEDFIYVFCG